MLSIRFITVCKIALIRDTLLMGETIHGGVFGHVEVLLWLASKGGRWSSLGGVDSVSFRGRGSY